MRVIVHNNNHLTRRAATCVGHPADSAAIFCPIYEDKLSPSRLQEGGDHPSGEQERPRRRAGKLHEHHRHFRQDREEVLPERRQVS